MEKCRESLIDFERYIVFENGTIISKFKNSNMSIKNKTNGYVNNTFRRKDGKRETFTRHRVIWYFFNGDIPKGMAIDHIDGNKENNSLENLRLVTYKENVHNPNTYHNFLKALKGTERCRKISEGNKGKIVTDEQKRKQSEKMSGKKHPFYGKKRPEHSIIMKNKKRDKNGRFIEEIMYK